MTLLETSQYSQRKLALRALVDQLSANPDAVGPLVAPEHAWQILAGAERRNADEFTDLLLYPTVGVWLTRALHHTRRDREETVPWPELGYLHLIAAAAAIRCGIDCVLPVPVWHGVVTLPTVGQLRISTGFPVGMAELRCSVAGIRVHANGHEISIDATQDSASTHFSPAKQHVSLSRDLRLAIWIEDLDPYRSFGDPRPPNELDQPDLAEWHKLLDEAWDVLTLWHPEHARELVAGLRVLVPVAREQGIAGASSPAAFGALIASANDSAIDLAETLVHELQHSKLNALLGLVNLVRDDGGRRFYAPWRDDPRPLTALLHGAYAFTCAAEFWLTQRDVIPEPDSRRADFAVTYRRHQVRHTIRILQASGKLSKLGNQIVDVISRRLTSCESAPVSAELDGIATMMAADHYVLWRLRFVRPETQVVQLLATAWLERVPVVRWSSGHDSILIDNSRPLPAQRRNLLRAKAIEPEAFAQLVRWPTELPGTTPHADAALCLGDYEGARTSYGNRLYAYPDDIHAWAGLALAVRAHKASTTTDVLLLAPEVVIGAHRLVRALGHCSPEPVEFAHWVGTGAL